MTSLEYIYESFIFRCMDKRLFEQAENEDEMQYQERVEKMMSIYLQSAIDSFNSRYKYFNVKIDPITKQFEEELEDPIREVLILRMLKAYTDRRINELNALAQSVRTKDFEIHSKANELKAVRSASEMYALEIEKLESNFDWLDGINRVYQS